MKPWDDPYNTWERYIEGKPQTWLTEFHLQLFDAETDTRIKIDRMVATAIENLDVLVELGNARQERMQREFEHPYLRILRQLREAKTLSNAYRSYEQQMALRERWLKGKDINYVVPGVPSHRIDGRAIDLIEDGVEAQAAYHLAAAAERANFYEPWHFEYDPTWDTARVRPRHRMSWVGGLLYRLKRWRKEVSRG